MTCKHIKINNKIPAIALRASFVGEVGWELYIDYDNAIEAYKIIEERGKLFDMVHAGYKSLDSLRIEKGYKQWGQDITPETNPYEAGLGFCAKLDKDKFIGKDALAKIKKEGITQKLRYYTLDTDKPVYGSEAIYCNNKPIGLVTSAAYGYSIGKYIIFAYVPTDLEGGDMEIDVIGERIKLNKYTV